MQVESILEAKGDRVVTIPPVASVSQAVHTLDQENIGALLVTSESGEILGILSERDIIRALCRNGPGALELPVSELMTRTLVTCGPDAESESLMERMLSERIRHLPVLRDGALSGIVSIGDVVKEVVVELRWMRTALQDQVARSAAWATEED